GRAAEAGHVAVGLHEERLALKFALQVHGDVTPEDAQAIEVAIRLARYVARTGKAGAWSPPIRREVYKFLALVREEQKSAPPQVLFSPDWDEAPDWAQWWAVQSRGYALWFEEKPAPRYGAWRAQGRSLRTGQSFGRQYAGWRASPHIGALCLNLDFLDSRISRIVPWATLHPGNP